MPKANIINVCVAFIFMLNNQKYILLYHLKFNLDQIETVFIKIFQY